MATDPTPLLRLRDGVYAADLVIAAVVHLDLFSRLASRPVDEETLCRELGLQPRPADVLVTLGAALGLLERREGRIELTALARDHLVAGSPGDLRPYFASLGDRPIVRELLDVLRTGEPAGWSSVGADWETGLDDEAFAERLTVAMDARGAVVAPALAAAVDLRGRLALLDVAGGSGVYAATLLRRFPHLRAAVLERPPVDATARALLERRGYGARVEVTSGDMFAALPAGFDVHLFAHVLHDWDEAGVRRLVRASFEALPPGGLFLDLDAHLDADKAGPLAVAEYSVLLMHSTKGRCWSAREVAEMLEDGGFAGVQTRDVGCDRSLVSARKP